jgi:probable rRNA maturation factor
MPNTIEITNASGLRYRGKESVVTAIEKTLTSHKQRTAEIHVVFVSDKMIHQMNKKFLSHNYVTDVITFPLEEQPLQGEIYISLETAKRQAAEFRVTQLNEIARLAVHGTLHLLGYNDHTVEERQAMTNQENRMIQGL